MDVRLHENAELTASELEALRYLHREAFAGTEPISTPMEWSAPQWRVVHWQDAQPVSHIGVIIRTGAIADRPVEIGGIGGVATLPSHRGAGLASRGMARALDFMRGRADFALLVCRDAIVPFYTASGWELYSEPLWIIQFGERVQFTLSRVMVHRLREDIDIRGEIDLCGPPW